MSGKIPQTAMNLKQFMVRQQVLKLYRDIIRTLRDVNDETSKREILEWARTDFQKNKHHTDEFVIKALIYHGERQLQQLQLNLSLSRAS
ncbi:unnamed protein product [Timema podura]|uniref:LYR motif-containing protein 2 n=1 Tax=Timema podura TaxID=61482 RepID=A0ABN7NPR5_TIMPD|nr:unnamed protein product [Timema podura]